MPPPPQATSNSMNPNELFELVFGEGPGVPLNEYEIRKIVAYQRKRKVGIRERKRAHFAKARAEKQLREEQEERERERLVKELQHIQEAKEATYPPTTGHNDCLLYTSPSPRDA